jgi:ribosomal protein S18 acetylase RimI-like enzyme
VQIIESVDWPSYKSIWQKCMKEYYWYKNDPVFDWNKYEELEDMKDDFGKPGNIFLEAHDDEKIVGVLGFRHRGRLATLRRWEPVTVEPQSDLRIHQELLTYSLNFLSEKGVERVRVLIKHPAKNPKVTGHLLTLFSENDFDRYQPDSIDLVTRLDDIPDTSIEDNRISIDSETPIDSETMGEYCIRAYGTTPEDLTIHSFDESVTDYRTAVAVIGSIMNGSFGLAPKEFFKIAYVDEKPAGFIGGFISESKHKPVTGILGPLGVFPEYRRRGIGVMLVSELFKSMKEHRCEYSAVGTPLANTNAIKMYQKAGYKTNCILIHLEKTL